MTMNITKISSSLPFAYGASKDSSSSHIITTLPKTLPGVAIITPRHHHHAGAVTSAATTTTATTTATVSPESATDAGAATATTTGAGVRDTSCVFLQKKFLCGNCRFESFDKKFMLVRHMLTCPNAITFVCNFCQQIFTSVDLLKYHLALAHSKNLFLISFNGH